MKSYELFRNMPAETAIEIFQYLHANDRAIYKAAIQTLATQRNLRAIFVERKPPNERHAWMRTALTRSINETLASHLLQAWLLGAKKEMLCEFLDAMEIPHADDGTAEIIPDAPAKEKIRAAVDLLTSHHRPDIVAIYLHAFQGMEGTEQWQPLGEILREEPRLQLQAPNE